MEKAFCALLEEGFDPPRPWQMHEGTSPLRITQSFFAGDWCRHNMMHRFLFKRIILSKNGGIKSKIVRSSKSPKIENLQLLMTCYCCSFVKALPMF